MKLIIDTNILISALIRDSMTRKLIFHPGIELISPEYLFVELDRYEKMILDRSGLGPDKYFIVKTEILSRIDTIPFDEYMVHYDEASFLIEGIDPDDAPFFALALPVDCDGIWSNDKDPGKQTSVRIYSTVDLLNLIGIDRSIVE